MFTLLLSFAISLLFGVFWMWLYYRQDLYEREPLWFVALIFLLGMPLALLAGLLQYSLDQQELHTLSEKSGFGVAVLFNFTIVAVSEELAKLFVVYTVAYPNENFNEPMDGIVYSTAAALGFATLENAFYVYNQGWLVLFLRGPLSTLGHLLFSALWGAALGLTLKDRRKRQRFRRIGLGLLLAVLAHGTYNTLISFSIFLGGTGFEWVSLSSLIFLAGLYWVVSRKITFALKNSPFAPPDADATPPS